MPRSTFIFELGIVWRSSLWKLARAHTYASLADHQMNWAIDCYSQRCDVFIFMTVKDWGRASNEDPRWRPVGHLQLILIHKQPIEERFLCRLWSEMKRNDVIDLVLTLCSTTVTRRGFIQLVETRSFDAGMSNMNESRWKFYSKWISLKGYFNSGLSGSSWFVFLVEFSSVICLFL